MPDIIYLANPQSPHVRPWLELEVLNTPIKVYHIGPPNRKDLLGSGVVTFAAIPLRLQWLPNTFQYIILGLILRFRVESSTAIHAHNTSGYGLAALLSNRKYIITTYGTEIFGAISRGRLYLNILNRILQKARFITSTSTEMTKTLSMMNSDLQTKIRTFSLGLPDIFLTHPKVFERGKARHKTWFVNRRIHPHYDTDVLVDAFIEYLRKGGTGRLRLLKGDADPAFYKEICGKIESVPEIEIIDKFLDRTEMIEYLDRSNFCISVPRSDQLSSSILEGTARGCVQVLAPLKTYRQAKICGIYLDDSLPLYDSLCRMFDKTSEMSEFEFIGLQSEAKKILYNEFSKGTAQEMYKCILVKLGIEQRA